jgi:hypothetical protein
MITLLMVLLLFFLFVSKILSFSILWFLKKPFKETYELFKNNKQQQTLKSEKNNYFNFIVECY